MHSYVLSGLCILGRIIPYLAQASRIGKVKYESSDEQVNAINPAGLRNDASCGELQEYW